MGTISDPLTEADYVDSQLHHQIINHIELVRIRLGIPKTEMRVLDWGCGRGAGVAFLREAGYLAYGVDTDAVRTARGAGVLRKRGYDPVDLLRLVSPDNRTSFPDNFFHCIFSYTVLEHVADLATVALELYRLTRPSGEGLHIFPGHRRVVEGHLFMPFLQWLPKGRLRSLAISTWVALGVEPRWPELNGKPYEDRVTSYAKFMDEMTFYRPLGQIHNTFRAAGFSTYSAVLQHPRLVWLPQAIMPRAVLLALDTVVSTLMSVNLLLRKP
jgi:SAM-dependent methyltransferase